MISLIMRVKLFRAWASKAAFLCLIVAQFGMALTCEPRGRPAAAPGMTFYDNDVLRIAESGIRLNLWLNLWRTLHRSPPPHPAPIPRAPVLYSWL